MGLDLRKNSETGESFHAHVRSAKDGPPTIKPELGGDVDTLEVLRVYADRVEMFFAWVHTFNPHFDTYVDGPPDTIRRGADGWPADLHVAIAKRFGEEMAAEVDRLLGVPPPSPSTASPSPVVAPQKTTADDFAELLAFEKVDTARFDAVITILTAKEEWLTLKGAYMKMLGLLALDPNPALAAALWEKLARLSHERLKNVPDAIAAYEMRLKYGFPANADVHYWLGACYEDQQRLDDAVRAYEAAAQADPLRRDSVWRLFVIHQQRKNLDGMFLAAAALGLIGAGNDETGEIIFTHAPTRIPDIRPLDFDGWKLLAAPNEDPFVSNILRFVRPSGEPKVPLAVDTACLMWAARLFGAPQEDNGVILKPRDDHDQVRDGRSLREHLFIAGREATVFQSPHYGYARSAPIEIVLGFYGAVKAVRPTIQVPGSEKLALGVDMMAASLRQSLSPTMLETLTKIVGFFMDAGGQANLTEWQQAIRITRLRAGLLVAGGLTGVRSLLVEDDDELTAKEKLAHALPFAVGNAHRSLRELTGQALGARARKPDAGVVIGGPDRRARTLAEMHFAASLRGCSKCGAPPKGLAVEVNGGRCTLSGACRFCATPAFFVFHVDGDPEKTSPPPNELGDARPSQIVTSGELADELHRLRERGIDATTRDRALTCILELLKDPQLPADAKASLVEERDGLRSEPAAPAAVHASVDDVARALVGRPPPTTIGQLENVLGIRLDHALDSERMKAASMGRFAIERTGLVTNVTATYAWDIHRDRPVASVDELRAKTLGDWSVTLASGATEVQLLLQQRFGQPRVLSSHHLYGGVWFFATRGPAFMLSRYAKPPVV